VLREPLERAVAVALANNADLKGLVESVLLELDEQNLIAYKPKSSVNFFTPAGRLVMMLMERPGLTVREMSVTLGCSQTAVIKGLSVLEREKLTKRKKVNGRYEYSLNYGKLKDHAELRRLIRVISTLMSTND
jgi:predicted transcriptional regulator